MTLSTGPGGAASGGSTAGNSGDLLLKTGAGGGNIFVGGTGGNAGHVIIQPGSGGSGTSPGAGGSTLIRASGSGNILAIQNSAGSTTYWSVTNTGQFTGTLNNTTATSTLTVNSQGAKSNTFIGISTNNTATSSTGSISKAGLTVYSTGNWTGTNAVNYALYCTATGGTKNYAGYFLDGNVTVKNGNFGAGVDEPGARVEIAAGTSSVAPLKLTSGTNLTSPQVGAVEWDGSQLQITQTSGTRRRPLAFGDTAGASSAANHYYTGEFTWTYSSTFGSGAISGSMTHGLAIGDPRAVFRPEDYGGVYNNATVSAAQANSTVIENIKAAMPDTGGIIELRDEFFVYGTIENARRPYINQTVGNVTNNGSGLIRISVPTNPAGQTHGLITGDRVTVSGVGGVTNANGEWTVNVTETTFFDLVGSTFAGAYTSGGTYALHRTIPFGIVGSAPGRSVLVNVEEDVPAIEWTGRYAPWVPSGVPLFTLRDLIVVSQGPGIKISSGGGGQLQFYNVETAHCKGYGWSFEQVYGVSLWNCRAFLNHDEGFKFVSCVVWPSTVESMWNQGSGLYAQGDQLTLMSLSGNFHVESNESWGLDLDGVTGDLSVWQEQNHWGTENPFPSARLNSRLRNCAANLTVRGQTQDGVGLGFDLDDVSRTGTLIKRAEVDPERLATLEPYDLGLPAMGDNATFVDTHWDSGYRPSVVRDGETLHIDIVAGTYNHTTQPVPWIVLFPTDLAGESFATGDWIEFVFELELDAAAGAFFYDHRVDPDGGPYYVAYLAMIGTPFSSPPWVGNTYYMPLRTGGKKVFCMRGRAVSGGTGAGLLFHLPALNGLGGGANLPPTAHRVSITNLRICRIPA